MAARGWKYVSEGGSPNNEAALGVCFESAFESRTFLMLLALPIARASAKSVMVDVLSCYLCQASITFSPGRMPVRQNDLPVLFGRNGPCHQARAISGDPPADSARHKDQARPPVFRGGGCFALAGRPCLSRWPGWLRCSPCGPAPRSSGHHHGIDRSLFRAISSAQFASVLTCMPISTRMSRACAPAGIRTCAIREVYEAALEAGILD